MKTGFPDLAFRCRDLGLPRLMLGGRTVYYNGDIRIGAVLRRESQIQKLTRKETANGLMAFVTVAHALRAAERQDPILVETQNYVLLGSRLAGRKATSSAAASPPGTTKRIVPDETMLFQYSRLDSTPTRFISIEISRARRRDSRTWWSMADLRRCCSRNFSGMSSRVLLRPSPPNM